MCVAIKPGSFGSTPVVGTTAVGDLSPVDTILDIIRNLVPDNVVFALTAQVIIPITIILFVFKLLI
jgi:hypothetical protein